MRRFLALKRDWFIERVGKEIKRHRQNCTCITCKNNETEIIKIKNEQHAIELHLECVKKEKLYFDVE
jgi:hypothetical protein